MTIEHRTMDSACFHDDGLPVFEKKTTPLLYNGVVYPWTFMSLPVSSLGCALRLFQYFGECPEGIIDIVCGDMVMGYGPDKFCAHGQHSSPLFIQAGDQLLG